MKAIAPMLWPIEDRADAMEALARAAGLVAQGQRADAEGLLPRAEALGVELHSVRSTYDTLPDLVQSGGPALLTVFRAAQPPAVLVVLGAAGLLGRVPLLLPDGTRKRLPVDVVVSALRSAMEASFAPQIDATLAMAGLDSAKARAALLARQLDGRPIGGGVLLRAAPHAGPLALARDARVLGPLGLAVGARVASSVLSVGGWAVIGRGALDGQISAGWLWGWGLLLLTGLAFGQLVALAQGEAAIRAGVWTKQMLLRGAMRAEPEQWRREGPGAALARVGESQAIEDLVLTGGIGALLAVVDLVVAAWVLAQGVMGLPLVGLMLAGGIVTAASAGWMFRLRARCTAHRRRLTAMLVERMAGHRTRLAQAEPGRVYAGEDEALAAYHEATVPLDRLRIATSALLGGGWTVAALALLAVPFVAQGSSGTEVAVALGGILLGQAALATIGGRMDGLVGAAVSWAEVEPLIRAARTVPLSARVPPPPAPAAEGELLRAAALRVGWDDSRPVLDDVHLTVEVGDRILLTGPSGSGKSTLIGVLCGARPPSEGLLLLRGLDLASLGPREWRQRVAQSPQFHDNHIFENTLAFNVLMGRGWPAALGEQEEAEALCRALGLGTLLDRMPAGMNQIVGESGWQLSHGERSRIFLARALLQGAELVVLDESFAALDPLSLERCLSVTLERAPSLVVIAHP